MKAAVCYEFGQPLVVEDLTLDDPGPGEVRVKLGACAICHSDIHYAEGAWGGELPAVYGHEAAGVVTAVGADVATAAPGDQVVVSLIRSCGTCFFCTRGGTHLCETKFPLDERSALHTADGAPVLPALRTAAFAEYVLVHESQVVPVSRSLPVESAALLACGVITGLGAVMNTARVSAGSSVVVIGVGGVGLNSVQGAALSGAETIIAVDLQARKLTAAREFGATHGVDASAGEVRAAVLELTDGRGADYVFTTVGSSAAVQQGMTLARRGGVLVIVGMPPYGSKVEFEATDLAYNGLHILGSNMGSAQLRADIPRLAAWYEEGRLKLDELVSNRYPLDDINTAIAEVKRGEVLRNVIVF